MSDYLNNLAARSTGRAEQFRPRLPSLFEAAPGMAGSSSITRYELKDAAVDQDTDRPANQSLEPSDPPARDGPPEGAVLGPQDAELPDQPGPFQQSSIRVTLAAREGFKREVLDEDARSQGRSQYEEARVAAAGHRDPANPRLAFPEEVSDPTSSARTSTGDARPNRPARLRQAPILDQALNDPRPAERDTEAKVRFTRVADQPSGDERQSPIQGLFTPRHSITELETVDNLPIRRGPPISTYDDDTASSERRIESPGPLSTQQAPTIKVTIGRVEVRAIVNDSQPQRPESGRAKPRITLDEYLKQRNGGQR